MLWFFIDFVYDKKTCAQILDASRNTGRVLLRTVILSDLINIGYNGFRKLMWDLFEYSYNESKEPAIGFLWD